MSQPLRFWSSSLLCLWERNRRWPRCLSCCHLRGSPGHHSLVGSEPLVALFCLYPPLTFKFKIMLLSQHLLFKKIYLFQRLSGREREKLRYLFFRSIQRLKTEIPPVSPTGMAGAQVLTPSSFSVTLVGSWIRCKAAEIQSCTPICGAGVSISGLIHGATTL